MARFSTETIERTEALLDRARARLRIYTARHHHLAASGCAHTRWPPCFGSSAPPALSAERLGHLGQALDGIDPRTRGIFLMHRVDGLSYGAIAGALQISPTEVEKCIARAAMVLAAACRPSEDS